MKFADFYKTYLLPTLTKVFGYLAKHLTVTFLIVTTGGFIYETVSYIHLSDVYARAGVTAKSDTKALNDTIAGLTADLAGARKDLEASAGTISEQQQTIAKLQLTVDSLGKLLKGLTSTGGQLNRGEQQLEGLLKQAIGLQLRAVEQSQRLAGGSR